MRFNCGKSRAQKRAEAKARLDAYESKLAVWHEWFAWFPVRVAENDCRWLEPVLRKGHFYNDIVWGRTCQWKYTSMETSKYERPSTSQ